MARRYVGIYGNVAIPKEFCPICERMAFIIDRKLQCCDRPASMERATRWKRETTSPHWRRHLSREAKRRQLEKQGFRCLYCQRMFDGWVHRHGRVIRLTVCWDHVDAFAYAQDNREENYVAACQVCNGIKSDHWFTSLEEARAFIRRRWGDE